MNEIADKSKIYNDNTNEGTSRAHVSDESHPISLYLLIVRLLWYTFGVSIFIKITYWIIYARWLPITVCDLLTLSDRNKPICYIETPYTLGIEKIVNWLLQTSITTLCFSALLINFVFVIIIYLIYFLNRRS
jgi:hypothetical protein